MQNAVTVLLVAKRTAAAGRLIRNCRCLASELSSDIVLFAEDKEVLACGQAVGVLTIDRRELPKLLQLLALGAEPIRAICLYDAHTAKADRDG